MIEISTIGANLLTWIRVNWTFLLFVGIMAGAFIFLRSTPSQVSTLTQLDGVLTTGQPTIIEFYSNFWATCLVAKPIVDGLERDLAGQAKVIRLDLLSSVGQQAASHFEVRGIPSLVVVDGEGKVVLTQVGLLRPGEVRRQVELLASE